MGLNASVRCNCIKEGKATPHPFPELLVFDEAGEPVLKSDSEISLESWSAHDEWYRNSCPHSGSLIEKRLGNIALVAHIRGFLQDNSPNEFPMLLEHVVYSGSHCGDRVAVSDVPQLLSETRRLKGLMRDPSILQFANDVIELAEASIATGNPIVF